jgi:uncharacterized protein YgiM (DUF1202 family)
MKHHHWLALLAASAASWTAVSALAAEEPAVVQAERVNVRGRPSMLGEVITQLKHGEAVTVLEEIPVDKPKTGEPAAWARIKMPENTPLWVNAGFIDPTNKTVKVKRLNVRAGAGENYSAVGRLEKGDTVKEIRVVDDWMEIETPTNTFAYVAADLIARKESPAAPAEPAKTAEAPKPAAPAPATESVKNEPPPATPAATKPASVPAPAPAPAKVEPAPIVAAPAPVPAPVERTVPATSDQLLTGRLRSTPPPPVEPKVEGPPPKRTVVREGYVRHTGSIQAPTDFELRSATGGHVLDYLHSSSTNLVVKKFKGKKVLVSGEEFVDERWPNRPVLEIDTIQVAP